MMPIGDSQDRFFDLTLTLMMDFYYPQLPFFVCASSEDLVPKSHADSNIISYGPRRDKPVFGVSDKTRLKPVSWAIETS